MWLEKPFFLLPTCNICTVVGVSVVILSWKSKIDGGSKVFFFFFFLCKGSWTDVQNSMGYSFFPNSPSLSPHAIWRGLCRMSSHHPKHTTTVSASFVGALHCSPCIQGRATMWVVVNYPPGYGRKMRNFCLDWTMKYTSWWSVWICTHAGTVQPFFSTVHCATVLQQATFYP